MLEIAVCAQHNNGGLSADANWETEIRGLFAVGEVCGSHGVTRPGGSALNAGQVGAIRATDCIRLRHLKGGDEAPSPGTEAALREDARAFVAMPDLACGDQTCADLWLRAASTMRACGGMIRDEQHMREALAELGRLLNDYPQIVKRPTIGQLPIFYRLRDMLIAQRAYLTAMCDYARVGGSRGSALYTAPDGKLPDERFPELFRCRLDKGRHSDQIQETGLNSCTWRPVRPIPEVDYFFETQWAEFRRRESI